MTDSRPVLKVNDIANRLIDAHEQQLDIINGLIQAVYDYTTVLEKQITDLNKELSQR